MRMLRNKAAHLRATLYSAKLDFMTQLRGFIRLFHVNGHTFGRNTSGPTDPHYSKSIPNFLPNHFRESLIHQDIVSFAQGLRGKVKEVIRTAIVGLGESYTQFKNFATTN